ncbi:MAG TPA: helix-turn-helix domain-containing protein [Candidatus Brocadiia bacterium]|nr:helix-turn-helix domain-containing protein [Planctomycetota bacterium]MDO8092241.1 helix-turn-helix domain-containing protein [Candidatus Brocadiales bacterium]
MEKRKTFGSFFKEKRIELGLMLRQFCEKYNLDAGNISKLERGRLSPPKDEILKKYAKLLNLKEGNDDWYLFFDLAAAEAGRIPKELREKDIVARMPVLFRTLRGKKISKSKLDKLIKLIKES